RKPSTRNRGGVQTSSNAALDPHNPLAPGASPSGFLSLKIVQRSTRSHATSNRASHVDRSQDRAKIFVKFLLLTSAGEWNCAVVVQHDKSILQLRYPIDGSASP